VRAGTWSFELSFLPDPIEISAYRIEVAAQAVGVSSRTLRRAIADGRVATVSLVAWKLVPAAEVRRLLASGERLVSRNRGRGRPPKGAPP
jgi:hypothetical protein